MDSYKSIRPQDVKLEKKEVLWEAPFKIFSVSQIHYNQPVLGSSERYQLRRVVVDKPPAVIVLPYDPQKDCVVVTEQVRPVGVFTGNDHPCVIELCAGLIDAGEMPEDAARRELIEENGLVAKQMECVADYWVSPGWTTEKIYLFTACVDSLGVTGFYGKPEENESIKATCMPVDQLFDFLDRGLIENHGLLLGVLWLARHRDDLRRRWK